VVDRAGARKRPRGGDETLVTLLHYIPVRKALGIDVIEERQGFAGLTLAVDDPAVTVVEDWETGEALAKAGERQWSLPPRQGRLLLRLR